jgi:lauroyl/myristoyl acyltransferase
VEDLTRTPESAPAARSPRGPGANDARARLLARSASASATRKDVEAADLWRIPVWATTKLVYACAPASLLFRLASLRGTLDSLASPLEREAAAALDRHLGETIGAGELARLLRRHLQFRRRARFARIWPQIRGFTGSDQVEVHGLQHLDRALADGKGAILVTAHFGHARLIKPILRSRGRELLLTGNLRPGMPDFRPELFGLPRFTRLGELVHTRVLRLPRWSRFDPRFRETTGVDLPTQINVRPYIDALARNQVLVILVDGRRAQALMPASVLGVRVELAPGAVSVARATGAALLPTFVVDDGTRRGSLGIRLVIHPPLELQRTENARSDSAVNLERFAAVYEAQVRARPDNWHWHAVHDGALDPLLVER